jgi:rhodanese-related sulfurtransferase
MKKLLLEILIIVILSGIVGLIYNAFIEKSLPLIHKAKIHNAVDDAVLYDKNYSAKVEDFEKTVTYEQLQKLIKDPGFIIIDARNEDLFNAGKIGDAINIYPQGDEGKMMESVFSLSGDKAIVCYCDGGNCDLSHELAQVLIQSGYKRVFIYRGGWEDWINNNKK